MFSVFTFGLLTVLKEKRGLLKVRTVTGFGFRVLGFKVVSKVSASQRRCHTEIASPKEVLDQKRGPYD